METIVCNQCNGKIYGLDYAFLSKVACYVCNTNLGYVDIDFNEGMEKTNIVCQHCYENTHQNKTLSFTFDCDVCDKRFGHCYDKNSLSSSNDKGSMNESEERSHPRCFQTFVFQ